MRYVMNASVLTRPGTYEYRYCDIDEAIRFLTEEKVYSIIGYKETADALCTLTGIQLEVNRDVVKLKPHEEALVFRLKRRVVGKEVKGALGVDEILANYELGILRRIT